MSANSFRTGDAHFQRNAEANAERFANGLSFPHHIHGESARRPEFANILQRRMRQRADRIEARIAPEFRPYFGAYVADDRRLESGLPESFRNTENSFAFRSIDLGERETIALDVTDDARSLDRRRGINDAGDHSVERQIVRDKSARINAFQADALIGTPMLEEVPPRNPILRGEHRGLRTHDRGKVAHYGRGLVRIHGEDEIDIITKI